MDIDEFLDKEVQAEKKEDVVQPEATQDTKEEEPSSTHEAKEDSVEEASPIEATKEDEFIKNYSELWNKVSEAKYIWDSNLFAELNKATNKIKEKLNILSTTLDRKKNRIKDLIEQANGELKNENHEKALRIYTEIADMKNSLPNFLLEEKRGFNNEIFQLYGKLHDEVDTKFINNFKDSIAIVDRLARNSFSSLDTGDIEASKHFYEKAIKVYKDLPNGFLPQKIGLGNQLLKLYKDLSIHTQIKNLQQQLAKKSIRVYKNINSDRSLSLLAKIIRNKVKASEISSLHNLRAIPREKHSIHNKILLPRLVARKLDRAKINLNRGLHLEAKKNLEAVLRVDPNNVEAKQMLNNIPA